MTNREIFNRLRGNVDKDEFKVSVWKENCAKAACDRPIGANLQIDMSHIGTLMYLIDQEIKRDK